MRVSLDFGFGYLKALNGSGHRVIFPSVAGELGTQGFQLSQTQVIGITTPEGSWLFGEDALEQSSLVSRWEEGDWVLSPQYRAGILAAITQMTKATRVDVTLGMALPYLDYKPLSKDLAISLQGNWEVQVPGRGKQRIEIRFPDRFPIIPQNIAPAFRHLLNSRGGFTNPQTQRSQIYLGILNVGSHTVELGTAKLTLPNGFKGTAQSRTEVDGMYTLTKAVRPLLQERFQGVKGIWGDHEIFEVIKTQKAQVYNEDIPVWDTIGDTVKGYCDKIMGLCTQNWVSPISKSDLWGFVISGGGAHILEPYLQGMGYHPNILVSQDPQWDVVEGVSRLGKMLSKEDG